MKFYNSRNKEQTVDFRQALWEGLAPGGGLYCPVAIPRWTPEEIDELLKLNRTELATKVLMAYTADVWSESALQGIVTDTLNFDIPVVPVSDNRSVLELFHGPTEAFKDVGARFMARAMSHFLADEKLTILVATSGDTGSAVADGFWNVDGIDVIVLFPKGGVSPYQESQMTTPGNNITAVEVNGTFDDCQDLVKKAFQDKQIKFQKKLSSANSINIGRLLPQTLYYYFMAQQLEVSRDQCCVCVPSGNFGNITSGLYANQSGLHFHHFIAATNANTSFPEYLASGTFTPRPSVATLSNAMDVGKPSNFERISQLFDNSRERIQSTIESIGVSDDSTVEAMRSVYNTCNYLLDPHAAVGWCAINKLSHGSDMQYVLLGTAHPRKFEKAVHLALPEYQLHFPENNRPQHKVLLNNEYSELKELILD